VSGAAALNGGAVTTTVAQAYGGAVTLGTDDTLIATAVTFGSTVDAAAAGAQGLTVAGNATFGGAVGKGQALRSLSVTGTAALNGGSVTTNAAGAGTQSYGGAVTLGADAALSASAPTGTPALVTFASTVDAAARGAQGLTVTGNASFGGAVGSGQAPSTLTVTGTTALGAGSVTTTGKQTYDRAITLTRTVDDTLSYSAITIGGTVDAQSQGGEGLTLAGDVAFPAPVGAGQALKFLTVQGAAALNGSSVTTNAAGAGTQTYRGAVTLGADAALSASAGPGTPALVTFGSTVDAAAAGAEGLAVTGNASFAAAVGKGQALKALSVTGTTALNGGSVTTSAAGAGTQTYRGAVTLGADAALSASAPTGTPALVTFGSTVDAAAAGAEGLTVTGNASFGGAVGSGQALSALTVTGATALNGGSVTTNAAGAGTQTYRGAVTLGADAALSASAPTGTPALVTFSSTVDAAAAGAEGLTVTGNASFGGAVGSGRALSTLTVTGATALGAGPVTTTAAQHYHGAITLTGDDTLTYGSLQIDSTVDAAAAGAAGLALGGDVTFPAPVGKTQALKFLSVRGATALNGGSVTTSAAGAGTQTYQGAVTLGQDASLSASAGAGTAALVSFGSTVDAAAAGAESLTVTGNASFGGAVGGVVGSGNAPRVLAVSGTTTLGAGTVTTTTTQTYTGAVTLTSANVLTTGDANITFGSTVDGGFALTLAAGGGDLFFNGAVGNVTPLISLTIRTARDVTAGAITAGAITQAAGSQASAFTGLLHALSSGGISFAGTNFSFTGGIAVDRGPAQITSSGTLQVSGGAVSLNGNALTVTDAGAADGISSAITGPNSPVTKAGKGTLVLTGTNTYGPTVISAGTLQIGNGGVSGTLGLGDVLDNAALHFLRGDRITVPNAINGTGTVTVSDGIVVTTSQGSGYVGATLVQSILVANGRQANSPVQVVPHAELAGAGVVGSVTVMAQGELSPGPDLGQVGTLSAFTVDLAPGAVLNAEVNGAGDAAYSRVAVFGNVPVTLDQATLALSLGNGFHLSSPGAAAARTDSSFLFVRNGTGQPLNGGLAQIQVLGGGPAVIGANDRVGGGRIPEAAVFPIDGAAAQLSYLGVLPGGAVTHDLQLNVMGPGSDRLFVLGIFRDLLHAPNASAQAVQPYLDELQRTNRRDKVARELWGDYPANTPHATGGVAIPDGPHLLQLSADLARAFGLPPGVVRRKLYNHLDSSSTALMKVLLAGLRTRSNHDFIATVFKGFGRNSAGALLGGVNQAEWVGRLQGGASRHDVLLAILASPELKRLAVRELEKQFHHPMPADLLLAEFNVGRAGTAGASTNGAIVAGLVTEASYEAKLVTIAMTDGWNLPGS
jgi:autotransporter-associated beta strand protein